MQVVYHLGVHCTDEDRLLKCLLKNRAVLSEAGVAVPPPSRYRIIFRDTMARLRGKPAEPDLQAVILDAMIDEEQADRLIFSHEFFISSPNRIVAPEGFYASLHRKVGAYANLFPESECEFHISLRNPATLIPTVLERIPSANYDEFMGEFSPLGLRWAPVIARSVEENPGKRMTVWANEDTPLIWSDVLRSVAGLGPDVAMDGEFDFVAGLMSPEGSTALAARLAEVPPQTRGARHRLLAEVLTEFALPDELEMPISLPGWTEELIDEMTANYDADLAEISGMHGVDFITA